MYVNTTRNDQRTVILLDTNVLLYASDPASPRHQWARRTIALAASGEGAAINAVILAEICVGDENPDSAADTIYSWGVDILDVPAAVAPLCAAAYRRYRERRTTKSGKDSSALPLPDFFIGAHAQVMGCALATADTERIQTYFPSVRLKTPENS
jgi:predicted nucleic acid-binding protein